MRRCLLLLIFVLSFCFTSGAEARKLALLIGADEYVDMTQLKCCVNNVKTLKQTLMRIGYEENDIQALVTGGAYLDIPSKRMIEKRLYKLLSDAQPSDTVLIVISGHGAQIENTAYFCPPDADPEDVTGTCVSISKIMDDLAKCQAKFKWIVVDTCRNDQNLDTTALKAIPAPPDGVALFQSGSDGELSCDEQRDGGKSYFMKSFIAALSGEADENHDGNLTLMEVCEWTSAQTKTEVQKAEQKVQRPLFSGAVSDFTLAENVSFSKAQIYADEARKAMDDKNYALAIEKFSAALVLNPSDESLKQDLELAKKALNTPQNSAASSVKEEGGILIQTPLSWSVKSIEFEWSTDQENTNSVYIYGTDPAINNTLNIIETEKSINANENVEVRSNLLSNFGLFGSKVNASAFIEGAFNYVQNANETASQWSDVEKSLVNWVLKSALDQNEQENVLEQKLLFTIDFINHTDSRLLFSSNSDNTIPVFCGDVQIGKAQLIGEEKYIAATGKPISFQFEMSLDERGKQLLTNNRPIIHIEDSQLTIRSVSANQDRIEDAIQESISSASYYTIAILSGNEVTEWKIRWSKDNPVSLRKALEAINEKVCELNNNNAPAFEIKDDCIISVCSALYNIQDNQDWIAKLKVIKGTDVEEVNQPDLLHAPGRGERYVFQLANLDIKRLESRRKAGYADAIFELAKRYDIGDCVPEDKTLALELLKQSAELGHPQAQNRLGECYSDGRGVSEDKAEAVNWYRKAAEKGYAKAQNHLGYCYNNGEGVSEDKVEAANWYRKAAEQGFVLAQYNLGLSFEAGEGVSEDKEEAVNWYRKAAEQGYELAQYNLGLCFETGKGVSENKEEAVNWYRKAAEQGLADAQNKLGLCYSNGDGVTEDKTEAFNWYKKAADQGHADSQNRLAVCYEYGNGVSKDMAEAVKWYRKAAEHGYAKAQCNLGLCYENGTGVSKDMAEAVKWYRKAAEQENPRAQRALGLCYENGTGITLDKAEAVKWYRKAAEQGYADAQNSLGICYDKGKGVAEDKAEAVNWYRKAAEQGNMWAQSNLGACYEDGKGVRRNYTEAANWYRKAAEQGLASAQNNLGWLYRKGWGVPRNYSEAIKWYRKAAEQGNRSAIYHLGYSYEYGLGVPRNYSEAVKWYRKAADQGHASAQCNLGVCYEHGRGVRQSYSEAVRWNLKAAEQGNAQAQFNMGIYYEFGKGVPRNYNKAMQWYRKAAAQGHSKAINKISPPVYYD